MPADVTSLPVEYLFTMRAMLTEPVLIPDGPQGTRLLVMVTGGTVTGPRLNGTLYAGGGDWVTLRKDGTGELDVRVAVKTDDDVTIHMEYKGILENWGVKSAPLFETSGDKYGWLNNVQGIAIGDAKIGEVTYEVYALR